MSYSTPSPDYELHAKAMRVIFSCNKLEQLAVAARFCEIIAIQTKRSYVDIEDQKRFYNTMLDLHKQTMLEGLANGTE